MSSAPSAGSEWFGLGDEGDLEALTREFKTQGLWAEFVSSSESLSFGALSDGEVTFTAEYASDHDGWYAVQGELPTSANEAVVRYYLDIEDRWFDKCEAADHLIDALMGGTLGARLLPDHSERKLTVWLEDTMLDELALVRQREGLLPELVLTSAWARTRKTLYKIASETAGHRIRTPRSNVSVEDIFERRKQKVPDLAPGKRRKVILGLGEELIHELQQLCNEAETSTGWALRTAYTEARGYLACLADPAGGTTSPARNRAKPTAASVLSSLQTRLDGVAGQGSPAESPDGELGQAASNMVLSVAWRLCAPKLNPSQVSAVLTTLGKREVLALRAAAEDIERGELFNGPGTLADGVAVQLAELGENFTADASDIRDMISYGLRVVAPLSDAEACLDCVGAMAEALIALGADRRRAKALPEALRSKI